MKHLILITCIAALFSCKKDNGIHYSQWLITNVEGSTTGNINKTIPLTVFWPYASGCDVVDKFETASNGNIIIIKAYGYRTNGLCTDDAGVKTTIYNFTSNKAGTFELRFTNIDSSYISYSITIN